MRVTGSVAIVSLGLLALACSKPEEPVVTRTPTHENTLARAPQSYQRMRFVSPQEQSRASAPAALTKVSHAAHTMPGEAPVAKAPDPLASLASSNIALATTTAVSEGAAPAMIVAAVNVPSVSAGSPAPWVYEDAVEHRTGAAVLRGGAVGPEKCDALTDAKARRAAATSERGSFRAPSQAASVFSRGGRN
jgi:hypothetical protein